jgi:hypothetical protein
MYADSVISEFIYYCIAAILSVLVFKFIFEKED